MPPQSHAEMTAAFEALAAMDTKKLSDYAEKYVLLKRLTDEVDTQKKKAYNKLMEVMEEEGLDRLGAAGANVTRKIVKSWGIAQGDNPEEQLANIQLARDWYNKILPATDLVTRPTVAMLKAAWETVLVDEPDAPQPAFLVENERGQLSVRKA